MNGEWHIVAGLAFGAALGELILLENQERSLRNREQIAVGVALVERVLVSGRFGPYTHCKLHCGRSRGGAKSRGYRLAANRCSTVNWLDYSPRLSSS
jgi:hypothetical protein